MTQCAILCLSHLTWQPTLHPLLTFIQPVLNSVIPSLSVITLLLPSNPKLLQFFSLCPELAIIWCLLYFGGMIYIHLNYSETDLLLQLSVY